MGRSVARVRGPLTQRRKLLLSVYRVLTLVRFVLPHRRTFKRRSLLLLTSRRSAKRRVRPLLACVRSRQVLVRALLASRRSAKQRVRTFLACEGSRQVLVGRSLRSLRSLLRARGLGERAGNAWWRWLGRSREGQRGASGNEFTTARTGRTVFMKS